MIVTRRRPSASAAASSSSSSASPSGSPVDPVQARLTQLGSIQARNLEELELQQPFAERTLRPLVARLSRMGGRLAAHRRPTTPRSVWPWPATRATCG